PLSAYDWPGNVRELDHVVLRAALRASAGRRHETVVVDAAHLALGAGGGAAGPASGADLGRDGVEAREVGFRAAVEAYERRLVADAIARAGGSLAGAARSLGMDRGNLHRLARRLGVR
ncbi:MAG: nitric oxide reductase transcription regulator, partial [Deltaproteobacteria bacterium]|nr:nitric oxide reductase transcription regulator [Deltaproteobacteria bacterium]